MFGYVRPDIGRLTVGDYEYYRAAYCGVCRDMGRCGAASRLCLSYDVVFLEMLILRLGGANPSVGSGRCPVNPLLKKRMVSRFDGSEYAAAVCAALAHYRFEDGVSDEKGLRRAAAKTGSGFSRGWVRKAEKICPGLVKTIRDRLSELSEAEKKAAGSGEVSVDLLADLFGGLLGDVCALPFVREEKKTEAAVASAVGRHVGRWIYIADALDDLKEDEKRGRFNPVLLLYGRTDLSDEEKKTLGCLAAAEAGEALDALSLISEKEGSAPEPGRIIDNVLRYGIPAVTSAVLDGSYRKPRREGIHND